MLTRYTYLLLGLFAASPAASDPVELSTFVALPRPAPTAEIPYGPASSQGIDVFLPAGPGPHPVAILIHGGCWRDLPGAGREQLRHLGPELTQHGIAVWSVGYRRADEPGGGYPGTFQDVAEAIDRIQSEAARYRLDLSRTVLVGHSAGGHLALWAAARRHLSGTSAIYKSAPFVPGHVMSLAGIGDLKGFARFVPTICGPGIIERLTTRVSGSGDAFAEVSPVALPAPDAEIVMVSGVLDRLVPPYVAYDYARALVRKGAAPTEVLNIPNAGHFDLVTPGVPAWFEVGGRVLAVLGATR